MATRKDPAAVALGKKRAALMTYEERRAAAAARSKSLTPEERSDIARKAGLASVKARAAKKAAAKKKGAK